MGKASRDKGLRRERELTMFGKAVLPIMADPYTMTIRVGPVVFDRPMLHRMPEIDSSIKALICDDVPPESADVKALHKFYCERLGPRFNRRFQAANYWMWVGNRMLPSTGNMLRHGKKAWRSYNNDLVQMAHSVLPYVNEAEADGLHHLIPAIVVFQNSPSAIRKQIGQGAWRRVANNSKTRNMRLMQTAYRSGNGLAERFLWLLDFPSGVLNGVNCIEMEDERLAARLTPKRTSIEFVRTVHFLRDTRRMLGERFNPAWGFARLRREHDQAVRDQRSRKYSATTFAPDWSFSLDGFTATRLTSPLEIAVEGDTQHHCVGSYANLAKQGEYLVLRIEGKDRATAGYRRSGTAWRLDQVYGACNSTVSRACFEFASEALTAEIAVLLPQPRAAA